MKKKARNSIANVIKNDFNLAMTEVQARRSYTNKKTRLKEKTDKQTSNIVPNLSEDEKEFEKFLLGENPLGNESSVTGRLPFGVTACNHGTGGECHSTYDEANYIPHYQDLDAEVASFTQNELKI